MNRQRALTVSRKVAVVATVMFLLGLLLKLGIGKVPFDREGSFSLSAASWHNAGSTLVGSAMSLVAILFSPEVRYVPQCIVRLPAMTTTILHDVVTGASLTGEEWGDNLQVFQLGVLGLLVFAVLAGMLLKLGVRLPAQEPGSRENTLPTSA